MKKKDRSTLSRETIIGADDKTCVCMRTHLCLVVRLRDKVCVNDTRGIKEERREGAIDCAGRCARVRYMISICHEMLMTTCEVIENRIVGARVSCVSASVVTPLKEVRRSGFLRVCACTRDQV